VEIPPKKKRGALNFVPLDDTDIKDDIGTDEFVSDDIAEFEGEVPSRSSLLSGLRPAPSPDTERLVETEPVQDTLKQDTFREDTFDHDNNQDGALDLTIENGLIRPANSIPTDPDPIEADHTSIHRSIGNDKMSRSWWKNLFNKSDQSGPDNAVRSAVGGTVAAAAAVAAPAVSTLSGQQNTHDTFLRVLSSQGLSPNAIVDNGCIVEAVQNRMFRGTKHMSVGVADRLGEPIRLLASLFQNDPGLKSQAVDFAVGFHHSLTPIAGEQGALMDKFGTETGRLFLMCDAALNG